MKRLSLLGLLACGTANDTAMRVRVDFDSSVSVDQLMFSSSAGQDEIFGPELRPVRAAGLLQSGDALLVLMPDSVAGNDVACSVDGLLDRAVVARGAGRVHLELGREVECVARLDAVDAGAEPPDAGPTCAGCFDDKGNCKPGTENGACGSGGIRCAACADMRRCVSYVCMN